MLHIVILAAGRGKRMQSSLPKVLHPLAGKPLLEHVVNTAQALNPAAIHIVYGHGGDQVKERLQHLSVNWIEQTEQLGTGHAVLQALPFIEEHSQVLILVGDVPLVSLTTLQRLVAEAADKFGLVTVELSDPSGLGRIIRNAQGNIVGIVEEKDATTTQKQIKEVNSGIIIAPANDLKKWLPQLKNNNAQGEYYLTDLIAIAVENNRTINVVKAESAEEVQGVNDRAQLAILERYYQYQKAQQLLSQGVTLLDPHRFDLRGNLTTDEDVVIDINVILEGNVKLGKGTYIGPNSILRNVSTGENVIVKSNSVIEDSIIEHNCTIGPFARLRPGTKLASNAQVGNFVEIKNSEIGLGSKVSHLSYVGDATVGQAVNIGAGTITCNYDGVNKHHTKIGDNVFVGSNTSLIAPITIGNGATIGAGSTITRDAPAETLTLNRAEQRSIAGWQRPTKKSKE